MMIEDVKTLTVVRGNTELNILPTDKEYYLLKGFSVLGKNGVIIEEAIPTDYNALKTKFDELQKKYDELKAENEKLKAGVKTAEKKDKKNK